VASFPDTVYNLITALWVASRGKKYKKCSRYARLTGFLYTKQKFCSRYNVSWYHTSASPSDFFAGVFLQLSATEHDRPTADMYVHPIALRAVQPSCCIAAAWLKYDGRTPNSFQSHQAIMTYQIVHGLIAIQVPASLYLIPNTRSNTGHGPGPSMHTSTT